MIFIVFFYEKEYFDNISKLDLASDEFIDLESIRIDLKFLNSLKGLALTTMIIGMIKYFKYMNSRFEFYYLMIFTVYSNK